MLYMKYLNFQMLIKMERTIKLEAISKLALTHSCHFSSDTIRKARNFNSLLDLLKVYSKSDNIHKISSTNTLIRTYSVSLHQCVRSSGSTRNSFELTNLT